MLPVQTDRAPCRGRCRSKLATVLCFIASLIATGRLAAAAAVPTVAVREYVMGTIAEVRVYDPVGRHHAIRAVNASLAEIRAIDRLMAVQRPNSDVSRLNRAAAHTDVRVDPRVIEVLQTAATMSRLTAGAFDITVLPVVRSWGFTAGRPRLPPAGAAAPIAGFQHVRINHATQTVAFTSPQTEIDLGGIAKGYALDRARSILRAHGIRSAYLDIGGNIATLGAPPDGDYWRIGIRDPRDSRVSLGTIEIHEGSVSTSANSEQFLDTGQQRVGHIFDPRTGLPAHALESATVVAHSATIADALSTAAIVLGREQTSALLDGIGVFAVFAERETEQLALTAIPGTRFYTHVH